MYTFMDIKNVEKTIFFKYCMFFWTQWVSKRNNLLKIPKVIFHIKPNLVWSDSDAEQLANNKYT